jgi:hypothetical protein
LCNKTIEEGDGICCLLFLCFLLHCLLLCYTRTTEKDNSAVVASSLHYNKRKIRRAFFVALQPKNKKKATAIIVALFHALQLKNKKIKRWQHCCHRLLWCTASKK